MKAPLVVLVTAMQFLPVCARQALANPPDATFKSAGQMYMARSNHQTADTQEKELVFVPDHGMTIDLSYHQDTPPPKGFAGGDEQKATSQLAPADIPKGIYLEADGGWYWSIPGPIRLYGNLDDAAGNIKSYTFIARIYCGPEPAPGPGCNVKLNVWFKQKPAAAKKSGSAK
jgi:hypothetical protein